jgi:hypothetical protein
MSGIVPSDQEEKVRENRLRRMAARQGLAIHKSRRRDPRAIDFGHWWVVHPDERTVELMDIDAVERYLTSDDRD